MLLKLSIIIPVYNVEKYLKPCLESVLSQNMDDIEIQIVLDYYNKNKEFMEESDAEIL